MKRRRLPVVSNGPTRGCAADTRDDACSDATADAPQLHAAVLDHDGVDCVLADLDDFAEGLEIYGKTPEGSTRRIRDIVQARDAYHAGHLVGLQLLYRFADRLWIDTLITADGATRMVRMPRSVQ